jgi:hypothetical protein
MRLPAHPAAACRNRIYGGGPAQKHSECKWLNFRGCGHKSKLFSSFSPSPLTACHDRTCMNTHKYNHTRARTANARTHTCTPRANANTLKGKPRYGQPRPWAQKWACLGRDFHTRESLCGACTPCSAQLLAPVHAPPCYDQGWPS